MKILLVDNYDSFTYNLSLLVKLHTGILPEVRRNDDITLEEVAHYDKILLSPGPGLPSSAGVLMELIKQYAPSKSILGVCLGHQAIAEAFGATLHNLSQVYHGIATPVQQLIPDRLFAGLSNTFEAGRYHSWVADRIGFPESLLVTAEDEQGYIMAFRHKEYDVKGIQFHPESILTPQGKQIMANWLDN
ncbi:MAG: aminodeoxychorismate/anthranilate synthase component II [Taibaiella sp.]|jgi:anthranilate synthase component 2